MTADQDQSANLVKLLTNDKSQVSPSQTGIKRKEIEWINDVDFLLDPIKKDFAVFETVIFKGSPDTIANFNETFSIPSEGVFSTYFLFGKHKSALELDFNNNDNVDDDD